MISFRLLLIKLPSRNDIVQIDQEVITVGDTIVPPAQSLMKPTALGGLINLRQGRGKSGSRPERVCL